MEAAEFDRMYGVKPLPLSKQFLKTPPNETMAEVKARIARQVAEYEEMVGGNFAGMLGARERAMKGKGTDKKGTVRSESVDAQVKRLLGKMNKRGKKAG